MPQHSALTGSDLHEPKGADAASADTVYVANGAGSGTWEKVTADSVDQTSLKNVNKGLIVVTIPDVSTSSFILVPFSVALTVTKITSVLYGTIATADATLSCTNNGSASLGSIVIEDSGSGEGDIDSLTPGSNNSFTANTYLKIETDAASTNTVPVTIMIEYTLN